MFSIIDAVIDDKSRHRALAKVPLQVLLHLFHILTHVGIDQFARFIDGKDIEQHVAHLRCGAVGPQALASRDVGQGNGNDAVTCREAADIVILF